MPALTEAFQTAIATTVDRMKTFQCQCVAIAETHTHADCTRMWHQATVHNQTIRQVQTVAQANALNLPDCDCCRVRY